MLGMNVGEGKVIRFLRQVDMARANVWLNDEPLENVDCIKWEEPNFDNCNTFCLTNEQMMNMICHVIIILF